MEVKGIVQAMNNGTQETQWGTKQKWGVMIDGVWWNTLVRAADKDTIPQIQKGDLISFTGEVKSGSNGRQYRNIKEGLSLEKKAVATDSAATAQPTFSPEKAAEDSAEYAELVKKAQEADALRQRGIVYQACLKVAGPLVAAGLTANVLPLGQKKADKWDDVQEIVLKLADRLAYEVVERTKEPFKSADEEADQVIVLADEESSEEEFNPDD